MQLHRPQHPGAAMLTHYNSYSASYSSKMQRSWGLLVTAMPDWKLSILTNEIKHDLSTIRDETSLTAEWKSTTEQVKHASCSVPHCINVPFSFYLICSVCSESKNIHLICRRSGEHRLALRFTNTDSLTCVVAPGHTSAAGSPVVPDAHGKTKHKTAQHGTEKQTLVCS